MKICKWCNKNNIPEDWFRCDHCAAKAIMNPKEKNIPIKGSTLWKNRNGNYIPRPSL